MNPAWIPFWAAVAVAAIAAIPSLLVWRSQHKKDKADALVTYMKMTDDQADEIAELRKTSEENRRRIMALEAKSASDAQHISNLERYIDLLVRIIRDHKPDQELPPRPVREAV